MTRNAYMISTFNVLVLEYSSLTEFIKIFSASCLSSGFICTNALEPANKCGTDPLFLAKNSSINEDNMDKFLKEVMLKNLYTLLHCNNVTYLA